MKYRVRQGEYGLYSLQVWVYSKTEYDMQWETVFSDFDKGCFDKKLNRFKETKGKFQKVIEEGEI